MPQTPTFEEIPRFKYAGGGTIDPMEITTLFAVLLETRKDLQAELEKEVTESVTHYQEIGQKIGVSNFQLACYGDHTMLDLSTFEDTETVALPILCFCPKFVKNHLEFRAIPEQLLPDLCVKDPVKLHRIAKLVNHAVHDISQEQMDGAVAHELGHLFFKSNHRSHARLRQVLQLTGAAASFFLAYRLTNAFLTALPEIPLDAIEAEFADIDNTVLHGVVQAIFYAAPLIFGTLQIGAQFAQFQSTALKTRFQNSEESFVDRIAAKAGYGIGLRDSLTQTTEFLDERFNLDTENCAQHPSCMSRTATRAIEMIRYLTPRPIMNITGRLYKTISSEIFAWRHEHPPIANRINALNSYCKTGEVYVSLHENPIADRLP